MPRKNRISRKYYLILLFPAALLMHYLSTLNSPVVEKYFSNGFYRWVSRFIGTLTGWIPFSAAEILFVGFLAVMLAKVVLLARAFSKQKGKRLCVIKDALLNGVVVVSVLYFLFTIMWGLNYHRLSLAHIMDLPVQPAPTEALVALNRELIREVNQLRELVLEDENGVMVPFDGVKGGFARAMEGFHSASTLYPVLGWVQSRPKPLLFSSLIAYTNIWGIYSPFTVEANVNMAIPTPMLLPTMAHEMAHQMGFAREDEANYIAYLTCRMHPDADFQYAGTLFALTYTLDVLYGQDRQSYHTLYEGLEAGVLRDLAENKRFHKQYEGPVREAFTKSNDVYLKANNQKDGERSYGRMVDLLLAEYKQQNPLTRGDFACFLTWRWR